MADQVGGRTVVKAGTLTVPRLSEQIRIEVEDQVFFFNFSNPEPGQETSAEARIHRGGGMTMTIRNLDNPLGTTFHLKAGVLRGQDLYVTLFVHVGNSGDNPVNLSYTFSLG